MTLSRPLIRTTAISVLTITLYIFFYLLKDQTPGSPATVPRLRHQNPSASAKGSNGESIKLTERLDLDEEQCAVTFPGLTEDVGNNVMRGKFVLEKSDPDYLGLVQGRIVDNKLHILTTSRTRTAEILQERNAILFQLHRALVTAPTKLPDTYFAFVTNDAPKNNSWVFARPNKDTAANLWLMPHFQFWSWPSTNMGTMDDVLSRISSIETVTPWDKKIDKAVWRGTPWFNPIAHPTLRQDLVKVSAGKEWADIEALNVTKQGHYSNSLRIEDFCKYKFIVYTEGVTYSGRLYYHQACGSVLLTPPLSFLTHTAKYMRPIDAEVLMSNFGGEEKEREKKRTSHGNDVKPLLPTVTEWRLANTIYVEPSFGNIESTIAFLRSHPEVAEQLANNQRDSVLTKGYLSPAAEACYWRALIQGWGIVAVPGGSWGDELGERFETWILKQVRK